MSFLSPLPLLLGVAAAAVVVALHLLTTRRPPPAPLPTARFVPVAEARAVSRSSRPTDLLLLALRMLAVLLVGAAFARPVLDAAGPSVRSVVLLERSRAVADPAEAGRLAREAMGEGGALVVFGDAAREATAGDSLAAPSDAPTGSLSAAFVAARGAAARIAPGADSVRLVVVSPLVRGVADAATPALRAGWPGRVELVRVAARADSAVGARAELVTPLDDDPLAPAVARLGALRGGHAVRIVRGTANAADSAWAREAGRVLVAWPARFEAAVAARGVTAFGAPGAVDASGSVTVVSPFAALPLEAPAVGARVLARWNDGAPAAVQSPLGEGCVRTVGIGVPIAGDITLREPFTRLLAALTQPCAGRVGAPMLDAELSWLRGDSTMTTAPARLVAATDPSRSSRLPAILLAIAVAALLLEQVARRRRVEPA